MYSMLRYWLCFGLCLTTWGFSGEQQKKSSAAEVEHILKMQQDAWNHQDIDGFMSGYWNSPRLTFFSTNERTGWKAILDDYRAAYASPGHEMGKLEFSEL